MRQSQKASPTLKRVGRRKDGTGVITNGYKLLKNKLSQVIRRSLLEQKVLEWPSDRRHKQGAQVF